MSEQCRQQYGNIFCRGPESLCKSALFPTLSIGHFRSDHISVHRQSKTEGLWIWRSIVPRHMLANLLCQSHSLLFGGDFRLHPEDRLRQQPVTFRPGLDIDVAGMLFAVGPDEGVTPSHRWSLILSGASGARFAAFTVMSLEGTGHKFS